jgi:SOS-response transcriptional repressor LexA/DNA-binding XRE family transcriptional regulator
MVRKSNPSTGPPWAKAIRALRASLALNQSDFGSRIGFSAMAVSRWERGAQEPPSHGYIALGNLALDSSCWFFWERAGLRSENVLRVLPATERKAVKVAIEDFEIVTAGVGSKRPEDKFQLVAIPLLNVAAGSQREQGDKRHLIDDAPIESMLAAPKDWCPNPAFTSCLRVRGNSMAPLILDGYVVAVDSSRIDLTSLDGKIVIAWHKDLGLTICRFRRYNSTEVLASENPEYGSLTIGPKQPWKIVGTVLWWVGKAP